jgi:HTH-type transcriptional regulator/antitoxin HigA
MGSNTYNPESISHPGVTLAKKLEELNLGSKEFAVRTGKPEQTISKVLNGQSSITPDMAVLFEDILKIPAHFWLERQSKYDIHHAMAKRAKAVSEDIEWVGNFEYAKIAALGWIPKTRKIEEKVVNLYEFFAIGNSSAFNAYYFEQKVPVSFRISLSKTKKPYSFAAWLRQGEIQASQQICPSYDKMKLTSLLVNLKSVMQAHPSDFFLQIKHLLNEAGVKIVYTPCLPGAAVHGSTRWIGDIPLIQLSARYKQNDIFWFTLFHEIAHILKHGKKYVAIENVSYDEEELDKEREADEFAIKWTFSEREEKEILAKKTLTVVDIERFANNRKVPS